MVIKMNIKKKLKNLWYRITGKEIEYVFAPSLPNFRGGFFGLSDKAIEMLINEMGVPEDCFTKIKKEHRGNPYNKPPNEEYYCSMIRNLDRSDPRLIKVIKYLGEEALGKRCKAIAVVSIPAYIDVYVAEDGEFATEKVVEKHRVWDKRDGEIIAKR